MGWGSGGDTPWSGHFGGHDHQAMVTFYHDKVLQ